MTGPRVPSVIEGVLHVHSTYSDGEYSLPELRAVLQAEGYRFAGMADHAEAFDPEKVARFVAECEALSDESFCFVPGLEFECERRLHVVGYGCVTLAGSEDPERVIAHIRANGGLPVIAHPPDALFPWIESFRVAPHGLEVWNSKYDGQYAPRPATFELLHRWRVSAGPVQAFYGVDLHWKKQFRALGCRVYDAAPGPAGVLEALSLGRFAGRYGSLELPASGVVDPDWLSRADRRQRRSSGVRRALKSAKRLLDRVGLKVPGRVKAELRRWL